MKLSIYYILMSMRIEKLELKRRLGKERPRSQTREQKGAVTTGTTEMGKEQCPRGGNMNLSPGIHTPSEHWMEQLTHF